MSRDLPLPPPSVVRMCLSGARGDGKPREHSGRRDADARSAETRSVVVSGDTGENEGVLRNSHKIVQKLCA